MTKEENQFHQYVDSLRFDDEPSKDHQDKLEKQLLEAYDHQRKYGSYVEPVSIYLRKLAAAAGFLIICGILFWGIDRTFITTEPDFIANHPERDVLEHIIKEEQVIGKEKKNLIAQMKNLWDLIYTQNTEELVAVLQSEDITHTLQDWAAKHLGQLGDQKTLIQLEQSIQDLNIDDPYNPLMTAAQTIRERLDQPDPNKPNH